ncbi:MAG: transcriptional regulator with XRE-family HTH domain [Cryomorphaceae bacterium]|jgi:transcriptional regulator with XRE-family HTH domain
MAEIKKSSAGELLRYWRRVRRYSQMELSLDCDTSSRHLSCVETGRAYPSRQLLMRICNVLEIPLRARNTILIAGGYSPFYQETGLSDPEMKEARMVLEKILTLHEPYPAMLIDRCWDIVLCNTGFKNLVKTFSANYPAFENEPWNLMKLLFHRDAWATNVVNLSSVYATMMERGRRSLMAGDSNRELTALLEEITELRPSEHERWLSEEQEENIQPKLIMPVHFRKGNLKTNIFTTVATLGAPLNITLQELRIECGYPVDDASDVFFQTLQNPL